MSQSDNIMARLRERVPSMREAWNTARPFRFVVVDDFLPGSVAEELLRAFPAAAEGEWDRVQYVHQNEKQTLTHSMPRALEGFFALSSSPEFLAFLGDVTGIEGLVADPDLVGGGLHQILPGGFLDVHIDYNFHPATKLHRRLNVLLYLNKDWKPSYEGYLELWDMKRRRQVADIAPTFNRMVVFETNEVSYHGHPAPLACPPGMTRKSLALYYYSESRPVSETASEHNTVYEVTDGLDGYAKVMTSGLRALQNRLRSKPPLEVAHDLIDKVGRKLRGLPPRNC